MKMEQEEDGAGKPQCCSGQGMGSAGSRSGCPGSEMVLWTPLSLGWLWDQVNVELSTFTTLWLSLSPQPGPSTVPGVPTPHRADVPGREEHGQDVLGLPNRGTAASRSTESAECVVEGP